MPVICNLGRTDRVLRIGIGFVLMVASILFRDHFYLGILLALAGLVIVIEGALRH